MTATGPRLFVANLDAEDTWAPGSRKTLPLRVRRRLAAVGSLFRLIAEPDDLLWLPAALDVRRLPAFDFPGPTLITGTAEQIRRRHGGHRLEPWAAASPWVSRDMAATAAAVNDRRFGLELARRLEIADPAACLVNSVAELRHHLDAERVERWVVKAPFSAAGRQRHVHRGPAADETLERRTLERLFKRHGQLVFEPWHDRQVDVGVLFEVADSPHSASPRCHRQIVDPNGSVVAIELGDTETREHGVSLLLEISASVAEALASAGYRGPAGVDAWRHRTASGSRWHLLGEINARWSLGRLARAAVDRLARGQGSSPGSWQLALSDAAGLARARRQAHPKGRRLWPLVLPDSEGHDAIWLAEI